MNQWKVKSKKWIVRSLEKVIGKLKDLPVTPLYDDLTPDDDVDKNGIYAGAIRSGLENKKVYNIAVTGPYGSGKSSILKTFEKNHDNTYHFLNISLATFSNNTSNNFQDEEHMEKHRALEKSILQQMIYRVSTKTIPFSRFRKITHVDNGTTIKQVFLFMLFIAGLIYFFLPNLFGSIFENSLLNQSEETISLIFALLLFAFISLYAFFFISKLYRSLRGNINFNKVTLANSSIEMEKRVDKDSIFDRFIDEILYFFQSTKYDVVFFEDLDRFDSLDIFERLRELNSLINNSELVNRRVVFIYAIKDDIFGEEEVDTIEQSRNRTKFFDLIIPIVPIIHSSNSAEKLSEKINSSSYKDDINPDLLQDISLYIDDMRILKNIYNEFDIYMKKLGGKIALDANKLFGLIIYKNLHPVDFSQLQYNQGLVYQMINQRGMIIQQRLSSLDKEINNIEKRIIAATDEELNSIEELQLIYLNGLNAKVSPSNVYHIKLEGEDFGRSNYSIKPPFFEKLRNSERVDYNIGNNHKRHKGISKKSAIATVFGTKENYFERESRIQDRTEGKVEDYKNQLSKLKRERADVNDLSLKELIAESGRDIFPEDLLNNDLLIYLVRHGYIDDTYNYYISRFHTGSLTKNDMDFILNVKNYKESGFSYSLNNIGSVISRLRLSEFKQREILNYDLLDFVLEKKEFQAHVSFILSQLTNEEGGTLEFITVFKERTNHKETFIKHICHKWSNMWVYIEESSNLPEKDIQAFLTDILTFADVSDIGELNKKDHLANYLSEFTNYHRVSENLPIEKEQAILLELQVKFKTTEHLRQKEDVFNFAVQEDLYQINKETLSDILQGKVNNLTYSEIKGANMEGVIAYVDQNINEYVRRVLLDAEIHQETEEMIIELLNEELLDRDLKEQIVHQQTVRIQDVTEVDQDLWEVLFAQDKLSISWHNVSHYYRAVESFNETMTGYLNDTHRADELSKENLSDVKTIDEVDRDIVSSAIIEIEGIKNSSYKKLASSVIHWDFYSTDKLSEERVQILIELKVLTLTVENYKDLKEKHPSLHVKLIEENITSFINFINDQDKYELDIHDFETLFNSQKTNAYKEELLYILSKSLVSDLKEEGSRELVMTLIKFIVKSRLEINSDLTEVLFSFRGQQSLKIMFLTSQIPYLEHQTITGLLQQLGEPYKSITENGRKPTLDDNEWNQALLSELVESDYISSYKIEKDKLRVYTKAA
ncbi:hypothetical protein EH196_03610 [Bacillus sp. C1-1]|nr:hypothetical protein EH196_03610 [Bacillus sp. C1-1]